MMRWTILFSYLIFVSHVACAWTIGEKGRVTGPNIHTTYFQTMNNLPTTVRAVAHVGNFVNGHCQTNMVYQLGTEELKSGDVINIDAFLLKQVIGSVSRQNTCLSIYYYSKQPVIETFQVFFNGANYTTSYPPTSSVNIL